MEQPGERKAVAKKMRIAVALDDSDGSFYALQWALDHLVGGMGEVSEPELESSGVVTLVHVQQPIQPYIYPIGPAGAAFYPMGSLLESMKKASADHSAAILSRASQMCKSNKIKAETVILDGDPKDMICEVTEQVVPDLLVLGSRGLGKIKRAFIGSVSDYCVHHARCPVLIVKPPPARETLSKSKGEK